MTFKGTEVGITKLVASVQGVEVDVVFQSPEGRTHATIKHAISLAQNPHIAACLDELRDALIAHIRSLHFDEAAPTHTLTLGMETKGVGEILSTTPGGPEDAGR